MSRKPAEIKALFLSILTLLLNQDCYAEQAKKYGAAQRIEIELKPVLTQEYDLIPALRAKGYSDAQLKKIHPLTKDANIENLRKLKHLCAVSSILSMFKTRTVRKNWDIDLDMLENLSNKEIKASFELPYAYLQYAFQGGFLPMRLVRDHFLEENQLTEKMLKETKKGTARYEDFDEPTISFELNFDLTNVIEKSKNLFITEQCFNTFQTAKNLFISKSISDIPNLSDTEIDMFFSLKKHLEDLGTKSKNALAALERLERVIPELYEDYMKSYYPSYLSQVVLNAMAEEVL